MGTATAVQISIGTAINPRDIFAFTVDRDMGQPDMAAIVLSNQDALYSTLKIKDAVEIKIGDEPGKSIYKGEVVGLEAVYKAGEKTKVIVRAMNKMHQLLRKRKSITFMDKTDQQIVSQVAGDVGLSLEWKHEASISYKHVYQHNQTDLEFIRMRAARMGCHVWCVDGKLFVKQPDLQGSPIKEYKTDVSSDAAIRLFHPRISSASIVKKVTVKGWNPETKELITGDASAQNSQLGKQNAVAGSEGLGDNETFMVDHPVWSVQEAKALAKARLVDLSMSYITGECEVYGDPDVDLGKIVKITSNSSEQNAANDPFNGNYYVMGVTHRYATMSKEGGYFTTVRLARDAQKGR